MSVDYYVCKSCGATFPDCGEFSRCRICEGSFCDDTCAGAEALTEAQIPEHCDCGEVWNAQKAGRAVVAENCTCKGCSFCRRERVTDAELLKFALKCLETDRAGLALKYTESFPK